MLTVMVQEARRQGVTLGRLLDCHDEDGGDNDDDDDDDGAQGKHTLHLLKSLI